MYESLVKYVTNKTIKMWFRVLCCVEKWNKQKHKSKHTLYLFFLFLSDNSVFRLIC